jgi:riboflavin kinase/FMN adenylyltransferase
MKIYRNIEEFIPIDNAVVTIGTFDGVHIGHQKILDVLKECAKKIKGETVLLTFFPHPRMVLRANDDSLRLINTIDEKIRRLAKCGIDHLIITPFTREFSQQSPEEYIREILINKIGTKKIVVGYDHCFGKNRSGSFKDLLHFAPVFNYSVIEIAEQDINDVAVSSTKIREALIKGEIEVANEYLGYPFELTGTVVKGNQIGRNIGFPTANIDIPETYKIIPAYGIYAVEVAIVNHDLTNTTEYTVQEDVFSYKGMGYIGTRPTVNGNTRSIEINIFDFNEDLYGKTLRVKVLHFIRHDIRYEDLESMKKQIAEDEIKIRALFND